MGQVNRTTTESSGSHTRTSTAGGPCHQSPWRTCSVGPRRRSGRKLGRGVSGDEEGKAEVARGRMVGAARRS